MQDFSKIPRDFPQNPEIRHIFLPDAPFVPDAQVSREQVTGTSLTAKGIACGDISALRLQLTSPHPWRPAFRRWTASGYDPERNSFLFFTGCPVRA